MNGTSAEEIRQAFREMVKSIKCPECGIEFTDFAVDYGDDWVKSPENPYARDGKFKLKCEFCENTFWLDYFSKTVSKTHP